MFQGVEWSIRWIPAGGFVKLPQMITSEAIEGKADAEIPPASPVSRILVAAAGPAMNVVFALAIASLIWVIGLPMLVNPPVIGPVEKDSPEAKLGIQERDRIVAVDGNAVKSWEEVSMEVITARTNVLPVVIEHPGVRTTYQLATRSSPLLGLKWLNLDPLDRPVIGLVRPDMPAAKAGMLTGDKFLTFAGIAVLNQQHLMELIGKCEGKPCDIVVERAGQRRRVRQAPHFFPHQDGGEEAVQKPASIFLGGLARPGTGHAAGCNGHLLRELADTDGERAVGAAS
jgi:regulator of sigma E protease